MDNQVCEYCGNSFNGHKRKYCSAQCRRRAGKNIIVLNKGYCKVCCKDISHRKASSMYCSSQCARVGNRLKQPTYTCTYCGKKYKPLEKKRARDKTDYTFCSYRCCTTYMNNGNIQSNEWENIKLIRSNLSEVVSFVRNKYYVNKTYTKVCPITGTEFISKDNSTKYSDEGRRKLQAFKTYITHSKKWIELGKHNRECSICGKQYIKMLGDNNYLNQCSKECRKQYKKNAKRIRSAVDRARRKGTQREPVDPMKVFERDNWICKICGVLTPFELRGKHKDNSPELDHIIPLSKGGSHTYDNVQCLCRKCNQLKADRIIIKDLKKYISTQGARARLCANR